MAKAKSTKKRGHPNCYDCEYRGELPGDAHSKCRHPAVIESTDGGMGMLLGLFVRSDPNMPERTMGIGDKIIKTRFSSYGIARGWANWPWNFDPIWLERCTGLKKGGTRV